MSSRVLVTGATGFIGHYIVRRLIESGYRVSALVREESQHLASLSSFGHQVQLCPGDLNNLESLEAACRDQDIVIHAAAIVSFDTSQSKAIMKVNVEGTANLVNVCLEYNTKHLIHISSIATLGGIPGQTNVDESSTWNTKKNATVYSTSKHLAELEIWRGSAEGLDVVILNPSVVIGPWEIAHHSMQIFKAVNNNLPFYPSGSNGLVDVRDVADAVLLSLEKHIVLERIIINGYNLSYREILHKISTIMGKKRPSWLFPESAAQLGAWFIRGMSYFTRRKHYFQSSVLKSVYSQAGYSNKKSIEMLGLQYRPMEQTLMDIANAFPKT